MSDAALDLPPSLGRFVVQQRYARYDAADQATWRFVLLHLFAHLKDHAHPSYISGLRGTGLSIDRIPQIAEIDHALRGLGWRAVAISGFIAPRAFQAFQAARVLPIATEIRRPENLAYTPAPDIIHEAAGHAPILLNPEYRQYLQEIGAVGKLAFSSPEDQAVYQAMAQLSRVKESGGHNPATDALRLARADADLKTALEAQVKVTEATRLSRLYWWTAEYGLLGTPANYRLYGAGLLSSLGEAYSCHDKSVAKRVLSMDCLDVDYDITRPQPQLFAGKDFAHLRQVLAEARGTLAVTREAHVALAAAVASRLPCVVSLGPNYQVRGLLSSFAVGDGGPESLTFWGRTTLTCEGSKTRWRGFSPDAVSEDLVLPLGPVSEITVDGTILPQGFRGLEQLASARLGARVGFRYLSNLEVRGELTGIAAPALGTPFAATLERAVVRTASGERAFDKYTFPIGARVASVLPADDDVLGSLPPAAEAPAVRDLSAAQLRLRELYERADAAWRTRGGGGAAQALEQIASALSEFPSDWLLRWNLLESLMKLGAADVNHSLFQELEDLEVRHAHRQPIATGLRTLRQIGQESALEAKPA